MVILYWIIAIFYGMYLVRTSVFNGYYGKNAHSMRGMAIFIAMCI
jgi:hypothetical protein